MGTLNPTAIKRWIALEARRLREAAGYDRAAAAERIGKATTVIAHIETARNLPAPADLEILLDLYGVPDHVPLFRDMIKRAKRGQDWWIKFTSVPEYLTLYLGLETGAARISSVDLHIVPGLFQTRDYAFAILGPPGQRMSDEEIAARVDLRMARQELLNRSENPPQVWSVLDEGALRRQVGGPAVMRDQLRHLAQLTEQPNIEIQVLPFTAGTHPATDGTFTILDYPPEFVGDPGTVYIENRRGGLYYETTEELRDFRNVFERLQIQAEKPERSREFILNLSKEIS
ncbi:DUF5753 domain-containing protein [Amycolatopsis aidingensis]|uniref:DUF5753 domain-containing protein n=1 Tax=Amycolatopsis aidingensis TaxID=2842453 RepID=UPI001C0C4796|nr:DUF5753 domain-containing protein [Amycolatopsis aidingensis]